jgi:dihydroflavonol-4-reductase
MSKKVLITGATGLLGNNILRQCLDLGIQAEVLVRTKSDRRALNDLFNNSGEPLVIHDGDITDLDSIRSAAKGCTHIIHAAGDVHIGWQGLDRQRHINVTGSSNMARVAFENRQRLVHVSTVNALGLTGTENPANEETPFGNLNIPSTYVVSKREADIKVRCWIDQGLDAVIVHPGFMLGPFDWKLSSGKMLVGLTRSYPLLSPRGGCSLCDTRDVASGIIKGLDKGLTGEHFILAGHNISYLDLWRAIADVTGSVRPLKRMDRCTMLTTALIGDIACKFTGKEGDVNSAVIRMSAQYHYYSSEKATRILGYQFREIHTIIKDAWNWLRQNEMA